MALLIPKIFHRVWLGSNPMPEEFVAYGEGWLHLHPGWEMRTWTDDDLPSIRYPHFMDPKYSASMRSDLLRFEVLSQFGGVYLDTDMEPQKSIEELLDNVRIFAGEEGGGVLCTAIIGSAPADPLWDQILAEFPAVVVATNGNSAETGPHLFTRHARHCARVTKFPEHHFYPYSWRERSRRDELFPESYAIHRWDGSWMAPPIADNPEIEESDRALTILVCSCSKNRGKQQACRNTWVRTARERGIEVLFVVGGEKVGVFEDFLTVVDTDEWRTLPNKVSQAIRFAGRERPGRWVFKCDDDTLVMPDRLAAFLKHASMPYSGYQMHVPEVEYASGGAGYLLSPHAVNVLASDLTGTGEHEDVETGRALAAAGIGITHSELFRPFNDHPPTPESGRITEHHLSPEMMVQRWRVFGPYSDLETVVARFNEDVEWTRWAPCRVLVYDKSPSPEAGAFPLRNVGREAHTYLTHLVARYDSLADRTVFAHGNPFHHCGDFIGKATSFRKDRGFVDLAGVRIECDLTGCPHHPGLPIETVIRKLLPEVDPPSLFTFGPSAHFGLSAERARLYPRDVLYRWLKVSEEDPHSPWVFERIWELLFGDVFRTRYLLQFAAR